jgi:hypothetical protein
MLLVKFPKLNTEKMVNPNNIVKQFTVASVGAAQPIPAQAANINFSYALKKRNRSFTFSISTLWGSFVFVYSQRQLRLIFEESSI